MRGGRGDLGGVKCRRMASPFARAVLHVFLAIALVLPGIAAPALAATEALAALGVPEKAVVARPPCDGMTMPAHSGPERELPAAPCAGHGCDLSACLGAGCIPTLPHIATLIPQADSPMVWELPLLPSRLTETPLRPPIA